MAFMAATIVLIGVISARGADMPALLILPLDMVDTSEETPSRAQEHEDRLVVLAQHLSQALAHDGTYAIIDPGPISGQTKKLGLFGSVNATAASSIWPGWFMRTGC
jgi:hypothetical protein